MIDLSCVRAYQRQARAYLELGDCKQALQCVQRAEKHVNCEDKADTKASVRLAVDTIATPLHPREAMTEGALRQGISEGALRGDCPGKRLQKDLKTNQSVMMYCGNR